MNNKLCNSFAEEKAKEALSLKSFSALNLESIKQTLKEALEQVNHQYSVRWGK